MVNIRHFLLCFVFFFAVAAQAQGNTKNVELKKILETIEEQHNVKFSYIESEVAIHKMPAPSPLMPLKAKLFYIEKRTGLVYKQTGEGYLTLYTPIKFKEPTVCGYLTDEYGEPLGSASVLIDSIGTLTTEADGFFEFPASVKGSVLISQPGYRNASYSVNSFTGDCKKIILKAEYHLLEEVVMERYIAAGITLGKDGTFIIKPKQFGILPGLTEPDVLQTMQQLPGIGSVDETVSNINVRGGTHDQNLFLWNGIRLFQTGHFFGLISALNPNPAYNVKISKNGTSAFYGESVSSVVDISSHSDEIGNGRSTAGVNMVNADFYTRFRINEDADIDISARRSFTDVIELPTYSKYSKRIFQNTIVTQLNNSEDVDYRSDKEFYFYDFTGQYHQKIGEKHDAFVNFIGIKNQLDFTEGNFFSTRNSSLSQMSLGATAAWKARWKENFGTEGSIYFSRYNLEAGNREADVNGTLVQENNVSDIGVRLAGNRRLTDEIMLHAGYQLNRTSIENFEATNLPSVETLRTSLTAHALIAEGEYTSPDELLYVRGGVRANYISEFSMILPEPRLQLKYAMGPEWTIEALGEMKSQTASQIVEFQDDFLGLEKRRWILANDDDIPVQKSMQVSAGVSYRYDGWLLSFEMFNKEVKGITTGGQAFQDALENVPATGSYNVQGTEFLIQKQFEGFYAWLTYTWNNNNYEFPDFTPYKFPNNLEINHTINSAVTYELYNVKVALGAKWFTGRPVTTPVGTSPSITPAGTRILYGRPNEDNIEDFFQMNFSATYMWELSKNTSLQFGVSVLNILNRQNIINRYYRLNADSGAIEVVNTYSVERTPNALIRLNF